MNIHLKNITFGYNARNIFQDQTITLDSKQNQESHLYGIIGPSGTGKTTIISILGGQLKPQNGEVLIGGNNIYKITEGERQKLIVIQLQSSTALRGKLDYNLRFGLNKSGNSKIYTDEELIDILKNVGLWNIFEEFDGLETLIGEGGINLSGGQRQRLNFASLYLRAKYYKPVVILIDEPTSSLDEISEKAITSMIDELARNSITIVVAHRLKTLKKATALLDSSLIKENKNLSFVNHQDLAKISKYYRDLVDGKVVLED